VNPHNPKQLIFVMLFFLAFVEVTEDFQRNFILRRAVLMGFFLAGLVMHGGLQQWWIAPVLGSLDELPLAGAVTGGGLTVIANAPNPAGQSILAKHFEGGISAMGPLAGALLPTLIVLGCFVAFR
jgi:hypothetical protein